MKSVPLRNSGTLKERSRDDENRVPGWATNQFSAGYPRTDAAGSFPVRLAGVYAERFARVRRYRLLPIRTAPRVPFVPSGPGAPDSGGTVGEVPETGIAQARFRSVCRRRVAYQRGRGVEAATQTDAAGFPSPPACGIWPGDGDTNAPVTRFLRRRTGPGDLRCDGGADTEHRCAMPFWRRASQ